MGHTVGEDDLFLNEWNLDERSLPAFFQNRGLETVFIPLLSQLGLNQSLPPDPNIGSRLAPRGNCFVLLETLQRHQIFSPDEKSISWIFPRHGRRKDEFTHLPPSKHLDHSSGDDDTAAIFFSERVPAKSGRNDQHVGKDFGARQKLIERRRPDRKSGGMKSNQEKGERH